MPKKYADLSKDGRAKGAGGGNHGTQQDEEECLQGDKCYGVVGQDGHLGDGGAKRTEAEGAEGL